MSEERKPKLHKTREFIERWKGLLAGVPGPKWFTREVGHPASPYSKARTYRVEIIAPQYMHGRRTHSRDICQFVDWAEWTDQPAMRDLILAARNEAPRLIAALEYLLEWHKDLPCEHWETTPEGLPCWDKTCQKCGVLAEVERILGGRE